MIKKIPINELKLGMFVHDLHSSWLNHPFWKSSFLLEDQDELDKLLACGIKTVSIDLSQSKLLPSTDSTPNTILSKLSEPDARSNRRLRPPGNGKPEKLNLREELKQARRTCSMAMKEVSTMFSQVRMGKAISMSGAEETVRQISGSVSRNPQAIITLARLKTADTYTYMHSVAVCALMIALAKELKLDAQTVENAGRAGLMHDVGKMMVPDHILNKPDRLTSEEFAIIRKHPELGAEVLSHIDTIPTEVLEACLHHHEKIDGSGYPDNQKGDEISLLSRMAAVCDVYDAITSDRAYKKGWGPAESLQRMASWDGHFDKKIFQAFVKTVGIYPVGSLVRLKSQHLAVVTEQNEGNLVSPIIKVFFSLRSELPIKPRTINLANKNSNDSIVGRESHSKWNFPYLDELWQEDS